MMALVWSGVGGCQLASGPLQDQGDPLPILAFTTFPTTASCLDDADDTLDNGLQLPLGLTLIGDDGSGFGLVTVSNSANARSVEVSLEDAEAKASIEVVSGPAPGTSNTITASTTNAVGETLAVSGQVIVSCEVDAPPAVACRFVSPAEEGDTITTAPATVAVACEGGAPDDALLQALVQEGNVIIAAIPPRGGEATSVEVALEGGAGTGSLALPDASAVTLELTLLDPDGLLPEEVTATIAVLIDVP